LEEQPRDRDVKKGGLTDRLEEMDLTVDRIQSKFISNSNSNRRQEKMSWFSKQIFLLQISSVFVDQILVSFHENQLISICFVR